MACNWLASSSMSYFNVYMFISQPGELSSSKFRFLNRLIQCCAVGMESTSLPIVLHMLLAAFVALRPKRNSWSKSRQSSLWEIFNSNLKRVSLLIILLLFARHLHSLYISQVWKLPDVSRIFYRILKKTTKLSCQPDIVQTLLFLIKTILIGSEVGNMH
jgi:hypothetical protein